MIDKPVALVTGASRGIGRAIAVELGRAGHAVVANYNANLDAAEETRALIEKGGGTVELCQGDIAAPSHRELVVGFALEAFGRIDLLVNNAGIAPPERCDILEVTESAYDQVMSLNLKGPFFLTQRVAHLMIDQIKEGTIPRGAIVNISSISAYAPGPTRAEYCVSKAGLSMMTSLYAAKLAEHGINVYEIRPGLIDTDMVAPVRSKYDRLIQGGLTPIKRWGKPEDVGRAVAAIARGDLPFSTGEVINVDGGFHLRVF